MAVPSLKCRPNNLLTDFVVFCILLLPGGQLAARPSTERERKFPGGAAGRDKTIRHARALAGTQARKQAGGDALSPHDKS